MELLAVSFTIYVDILYSKDFALDGKITGFSSNSYKTNSFGLNVYISIYRWTRYINYSTAYGLCNMSRMN